MQLESTNIEKGTKNIKCDGETEYPLMIEIGTLSYTTHEKIIQLD